MIIDILLVVILGVVTWCVASEGLVGATQLCVIVILSGLLAMNFFEPLAGLLEAALPAGAGKWADLVALLGLFGGLTFLLRLLAERIGPGFPDAPQLLYEAGRWSIALLTGYIAMAIVCTAVHTAPVSRNFWGFTPERANLFGVMAPDRQWLGFTQYVSEKSLSKWGTPNIFDGPKTKLGNPGDPYNNEVWSSFPIRYATRRERFETSAAPQKASAGSLKLREPAPSQSTPSNNSNEAPTGF
ncbi:MAG TPA: CvpA family protein [Planctomycetaceae bacterium]|nr:CvpA family protein [Planctomycetaceae bacterium]